MTFFFFFLLFSTPLMHSIHNAIKALPVQLSALEQACHIHKTRFSIFQVIGLYKCNYLLSLIAHKPPFCLSVFPNKIRCSFPFPLKSGNPLSLMNQNLKRLKNYKAASKSVESLPCEYPVFIFCLEKTKTKKKTAQH